MEVASMCMFEVLCTLAFVVRLILFGSSAMSKICLRDEFFMMDKMFLLKEYLTWKLTVSVQDARQCTHRS